MSSLSSVLLLILPLVSGVIVLNQSTDILYANGPGNLTYNTLQLRQNAYTINMVGYTYRVIGDASKKVYLCIYDSSDLRCVNGLNECFQWLYLASASHNNDSRWLTMNEINLESISSISLALYYDGLDFDIIPNDTVTVYHEFYIDITEKDSGVNVTVIVIVASVMLGILLGIGAFVKYRKKQTPQPEYH